MKLFFDTETSGKADFKKPIQDPCQPRLVQLAAILTRDNCEEVSHAKLLIAPNGWTIDPDAEKVHGISLEHAQNSGVNVMAALSVFFHMADAADSFHAFNFDFDSMIMSIEYDRAAKTNPLIALTNRDKVCEMRIMTPICKLPPNYRGGDHKWPNLQEAYRHCFKKDFDGAHDALSDVRAMIAIHKWRLENNL